MNPPQVHVGMKKRAVVRLLGRPDAKISTREYFKQYESVTFVGGAFSSLPQVEAWRYDHPAGVYELLIGNGRVSEVRTQPGLPSFATPSLRISRLQLDDIIGHAVRDAPTVCCGLLTGGEGTVTSVHQLENVAASALRFEIAGLALVSVLDEAAAEDDLVAIYCSRTNGGEPYPSQTDVNFAANWPGVQWLIVSVSDHAAPEARSFLIEGETIVEARIEVT